MSKEGYLILAIAVLAVLLLLFVLSFILFIKTKVPKGCQKQPSELCGECPNKHCEFSLYQAKGKWKEEQEEKENKDEHRLD